MLHHQCAAAAWSAQSDSLPLTAANRCNIAHKGGGSPGSEGSCTQQAQVRDAVHRRESRRRDCHTAIEQRCRLKSFAFLAPVQSRDRSDTASVHRSPTRGESRSEEHTSELQSLMRISHAALCLKKTIKSRIQLN